MLVCFSYGFRIKNHMNQFYDTLVHILKLEVPVYWNYMEKSKINYKKII